MSLKYGLLGLLKNGPLTGYDLQKYFNESLYFFWQSQSSQIYRELKSMEQIGWLEVETIVQHDKPNKKLYSIKKKGYEALNEWLVQAPLEHPRYGFLIRVFFSGALSNKERIDLFESYIVQQQKLYDDLITIKQKQACGHDDEVYWDFTIEYGLASANMAITWANQCIKQLKKGD